MDRLPRLKTGQPKLHINGMTPITPLAGVQSPQTGDITSPVDERRAKLFSGISRRQTTQNIHDFRYAWSFYHDAASKNTSTTYENRLTLLQDDIMNPKIFWQVMNNFPFQALKLKDSVHFFKRGVKPVWEDRRNVRGGAWTFRIPKAQSEDFFREVLLMSIGEQFADAIQSGDDLCGISLSIRFNSNLISIWHRRSDNEISKNNILTVVENTISEDLKPLCVPKNCYYKAHAEHAGFSEVVAKAREGESVEQGPDEEGKIKEAEVGVEEKGEKAAMVQEGKEDGGMEVSDI